MPQTITCVELHSDEWARLRDIRLRALLDSPHAFGGTYENESNFDESRWHIEFAKQTFLVASVDGIDAEIYRSMVHSGYVCGDYKFWIV